MNKKIVGFVLAACLTLGLGVANLFADIDTKNSAGSINVNSMALYKADNDTGKVKQTKATSAFGIDKNKICAVFHYIAGSCTSMVDKDNNITLYNAGSPFLTLGYSSGTYSVTGVNLSGVDSSTIDTSGDGKVDKNELKNFLNKVGVSEQMLNYSSYTASGQKDEDGEDIMNINQKTVEWLDKACEALNSGINHSISIDITATKGASLTIQENGQNQRTIAYDGEEIQTFQYTPEGFLTSVKSVVYISSLTASHEEVAKASSTAKGSSDGKYGAKRVVDGFDEYRVEQTTNYNAYGQATSVVRNGETIASYTYSTNGSMLSSYDAITKQTTYYLNGQQSYVLNSSGAVVTRYSYLENGSLDGVTQYSSSGTPTSITAYQFGKAIGTADLSSATATGTGIVRTFNELRVEVAKMKQQGANYFSADRKTNITNVAIYTEDLKNTSLLRALGWEMGSIGNAALWSNGYSQVGSISLSYGSSTNTATVDGSDATESQYFPDGAKGKYIKQKHLLKETLKKGGTVTVMGPDGKKKITLKKGQHVKVNGEELTAEQYVNYLGTAKDGLGSKNDGHSDESSNPGLKALMGATVSGVNKDEILAEVAGFNDNQYYAHDLKNAHTSSYKLSTTIQVFDRGAQVYHQTGTTLSEKNVAIKIDPAVKGTFQGTKTVDGKTYAVVKADEVNVMDGSGFQKADGETVLVEVNEQTAASLKNMKKGAEIMFMGDVKKDTNGYMTMKMNTDYSGGVATGSQINQLRDAIQNEKLDWVKENTATNTAIFGNNGVAVDWKAGWNVLTGKNKAEDLKKKMNENGAVYLAF